MYSFYMDSPRIMAYNIHEWVFNTLKIPEDDQSVLQIDGPRRKVYLKFDTTEKITGHLNVLQGDYEYKHDTGEVTTVTVSRIGLGYRSVRVASLSPKVKDQALNACLSQYGTVKQITEDK
jgi:hypothetical protein